MHCSSVPLWRAGMRGGFAPRAPFYQRSRCAWVDASRLNTQRVPVALPVECVDPCEWAQHPEGTRRAPGSGRSAPPNPLHLMLAAREMHRCMPPLCRMPDYQIAAFFYLEASLYLVKTSLVSCLLLSARRHAHQALSISMNRIGNRRGVSPSPGCRVPVHPAAARAGHLHI
jgi:hypothetical protein